MVEPVGFRFLKQDHLKSPAEVRCLFREGQRFGCRGMRLIVRKNDRENTRIVFAPARGYGNAVERNRVRRIAKEIFRTHKYRLTTGFDLALIMYPGDYSYMQRKEQMMYLWRKAGVCASGE